MWPSPLRPGLARRWWILRWRIFWRRGFRLRWGWRRRWSRRVCRCNPVRRSLCDEPERACEISLCFGLLVAASHQLVCESSRKCLDMKSTAPLRCEWIEADEQRRVAINREDGHLAWEKVDLNAHQKRPPRDSMATSGNAMRQAMAQRTSFAKLMRKFRTASVMARSPVRAGIDRLDRVRLHGTLARGPLRCCGGTPRRGLR